MVVAWPLVRVQRRTRPARGRGARGCTGRSTQGTPSVTLVPVPSSPDMSAEPRAVPGGDLLLEASSNYATHPCPGDRRGPRGRDGPAECGTGRAAVQGRLVLGGEG